MTEELLVHILRLLSRVFYPNPAVAIVMDYLCGAQKYLKFQVSANGRKEDSPIRLNNLDLDYALSILAEQQILAKDITKRSQYYEFNRDLINVLRYRLMALKKAIDGRKDKVRAGVRVAARDVQVSNVLCRVHSGGRLPGKNHVHALQRHQTRH